MFFLERNKSSLYKAKDAVEGNGPKNKKFIIKWRQIQLEWRNGRMHIYCEG
jgi:hypothetical protein